MEVLRIYKTVKAGFAERLYKVAGGQWHLPTPCTKWDVRDLLHHLVYVQRWVPPLAAGETVAEVGDRFEGEMLGDDPIGAWEESIAAALDAFAAPGAMERQIQLLAYGLVSGEELAYDMAMDLLVHTWDLSRAIGANQDLDPEATRVVHDWLESVDVESDLGFSLPRLRLKGFFAPRVITPENADTQTRMLAIVGRRSF